MPRLLACLLALLPSLAEAQGGPCAEHQMMVELLARSWGESRQAMALDAAGSLVEIFASAETGTWTITITRPGGPACAVAWGGAYEELGEPLPEWEVPA